MSGSDTQLRAPDLPSEAGPPSGPGLVFLETPLRVAALRADIVTVGREGDVGVVLRDADASRNHAELRREGDRWAVRDLSSTNGTFVNGRRVREGAIEDGDVVRFAGTLALFTDSNVAAFEQQPVPPDAEFVGGPR